MAAKYYQSFSVTGSANTKVYDAGLTSSEEEPKTCIGIMITVSDYKDNEIEVWIERDRIATLRDYNFDTYAGTGGTNTYYSHTKTLMIPIDHEIAVGDTIKIGISSGANATNLRGSYVYEIRS